MEILNEIHGREDLLALNDREKIQLCSEIRSFLVQSVSQTGGHLAGNLGVVELSLAIETVFDTRVDRLVFDVGHQSYTHKILTGRKDRFQSLRQYGGISGFPKPSESETDAFIAGHASSAVSIALGMARARTILGQKYHVIALLGDGAATGGLTYEGLNDAGASREPLIIILNDNEMSIGKNVGGMSRHLSRLRSSPRYQGTKLWYKHALGKIPGGNQIYRASSNAKKRIKRALMPVTLFEAMGLSYLGPVDGHDLQAVTMALQAARTMERPVLVHVVTQKGHGYSPAEKDPSAFHGIGKFDIRTGKPVSKDPNFSSVFGECMLQLAEKNPNICAITAAMPSGTGLSGFVDRFPERFFDVGIAEEHAVSMAGGMAKQGLIPVFAVYSTFLQRAYDQILQDVAMLHLHVVFAIDRAGLVGDDGPTHHGVFDVGFLSQVPGMLILAPCSFQELRDMLSWAVDAYHGPVAIRYPRGGEGLLQASAWDIKKKYRMQSKIECLRQGKDIAVVSYGVNINEVLEAAAQLQASGIEVCVVRLTVLSEIDQAAFFQAIGACRRVLVVEETIHACGVQSKIQEMLCNSDIAVHGIDTGNDFVPHGDQRKLYEFCGLDVTSIVKRVREVLIK